MAEQESGPSCSGHSPLKRTKVEDKSRSNNLNLEDESQSKRLKLEDECKPKQLKLEVESKSKGSESKDETLSVFSEETSLLKFCDDLLLEIFSYLRHSDLIVLSKCCQRFQGIVSDRTLWTRVDLRHVTLSEAQLQEYIKFFLPATTFFATKGPWKDHHHLGRETVPFLEPEWSTDVTVTAGLIESISNAAQNLKTLIFENHILGDLKLTWDKFPKTIENFTLRSCHFPPLPTSSAAASNTRSYFSSMNQYLPNLKRLDLSNLLWFESNSLLALSKCSNLQELRLADCPLSDFVPYISLSTRFGFQSLVVVDLRRTWVNDREVSCLSKTETLRELYLESPADPAGPTLVTDMALTAFGATPHHWNRLGYHVIVLDQFHPVPPPSIEVLQVTNYRTVTDISLQHCADCLRDLRRLDVRGTGVTRERVVHFNQARPEVTVVSDYDLDCTQPTQEED